MLNLLILLAIGFLLAVCGAIVYTAWAMTHPRRRTYASAVAKGLAGDPGELSPPIAFETWSVQSRAHELPAWDMRGEDEDGPVVVMVHGWDDSRIGSLVRVGACSPCCSRIVAIDLPGHGESPGICSLGVREPADISALLDAMETQHSIVLFGWSLGAGLAIEFAAHDDRIAGVIAEAPYRLAPTPARNVMRAQRLPYRLNLLPTFWLLNLAFNRRLVRARFDRAVHAAELGCPLLVLHGEHDEISPLEDGQEIAAAAPDGQLAVIENGDHNGLWTEDGPREQCERVVRKFLTEIESTR